MAVPAFIVEGQFEQRVIQLVCPGHKVVLLGANGDDVSAPALTARIETHFRRFSNRYFPIVVIFDRERRKSTPAQIEQELRELLSIKGIDAGQFIFFISDRDIEVLFLCHIGEDGNFVDDGCPRTKQVDGLLGEGELRKRLSRVGVHYHKTTVGIEMFKRLRPSILAQKSDNFARFRSGVVEFCRWATF
jgi:hypothetical protein